MRWLRTAGMLLVFGTFVASAEKAVVMRDGTVVKCEKFELKGNVYVLTMASGKLQSVRADKVDADATASYEQKLAAQAEAEAKRKEAAKAAPASPGEKPEAVKLTDEDLEKYKGRRGMGDESSVTADKGPAAEPSPEPAAPAPEAAPPPAEPPAPPPPPAPEPE